MRWVDLSRPGDDADGVLDAVLDDFDTRWVRIGASIRRQLLAQGADLRTALEVAEAARHYLRAEEAERVPTIMDCMAARASPQH